MTRREYPDAPMVGVGAVVLHEGQVLLVRRGQEPLKGAWSLPGGAVELGETLETAIRREVAEETGLMVEVVQRLEVLDRIVFADRTFEASDGASARVRYHYVLIDFLCRVLGGSLACASDAAEVQWFRRELVREGGPYGLDRDVVRVIEAGFRASEPEQR